MYNSFYYYPPTQIVRSPTHYYSNVPFFQREVLLVPQRGYHQYFQSPNQNTFIESYKYDQIQTDYVNIPTDEYVIVQTSRINSMTTNEKGEQIKESVPGKTNIINYKSTYGGMPTSILYPKVVANGNRKEVTRNLKAITRI